MPEPALAPSGPTPAAPGMPVTVADLLRRTYTEYADLAAVVDGQWRLTYSELGALVATWRTALDRLGVPVGDPVLLVAENSAEFLVTEQAVFTGARVRVAVSPKLSPVELASIISDCRPGLVLVDERTSPQVALALESVAPSPHPVVVTTGEPAAGELTWQAVLELPGAPAPTPAVPVHRPDDVVALLYTSGTTGMPKGAQITHAGWMAMLRNSLCELGPIAPGDRFLTVAPMTHLGGYLSLCFVARGGCQVVHRGFDAARVLAALRHDDIVHVPLVPTMIKLLVDEVVRQGLPQPFTRLPDTSGSSLRTIVYAGSPIDPEILRRAVTAFGPVFVQFFGLSEIPMPLTCLTAADHAHALADPTARARLSSAGRVIPFVDLRIVDEHGREVPTGEIGEICASSDTTMTGYMGRPEATAEALHGNWLRTGDLGHLDEAGYLFLSGRAKDMIITGGHNVYPEEVEAVVRRVARVVDVAVLGIPDPTWGEVVHAAVVADGPPIDEAEWAQVRQALGLQLAAYKVPRRFSSHDALPRNGVGKVLRRVLRQHLVPNPAERSS